MHTPPCGVKWRSLGKFPKGISHLGPPPNEIPFGATPKWDPIWGHSQMGDPIWGRPRLRSHLGPLPNEIPFGAAPKWESHLGPPPNGVSQWARPQLGFPSIGPNIWDAMHAHWYLPFPGDGNARPTYIKTHIWVYCYSANAECISYIYTRKST